MNSQGTVLTLLLAKAVHVIIRLCAQEPLGDIIPFSRPRIPPVSLLSLSCDGPLPIHVPQHGVELVAVRQGIRQVVDRVTAAAELCVLWIDLGAEVALTKELYFALSPQVDNEAEAFIGDLGIGWAAVAALPVVVECDLRCGGS